ncbi:MAG: hypothetical protein AUI42_09435 [Actinobacteria bacterium 13_1_40CM_2_65_8]|nr:MAG: hypothetical protein AUH69_02665 [Actinobacteria bacterium 13_1_40CM_4_65_12]OLD49113.1 MAG: hypothetical protein AUI42_09435 [Actinobacteria bacterium 13_1_40CM_2_65_8]
MALKTERTTFSLDVIGRYMCNTWQEAMGSTDQAMRPDARAFDVIVLGGGTFGAAVAQHLFNQDISHTHRILVLEGGPFLIPEHSQNLPVLGLGVPAPTSIAELRAQGQDNQPRQEVWGLAWHSPVRFPGLAYCVGGRSVYWGGWSPQLLNSEMPTDAAQKSPWPQAVVDELNNRYFAESNEQIGSDVSNYYIFGTLQNGLRQLLSDGIGAGKVTDSIPLANLPDHAGVRALAQPPDTKQLANMLGLDTPGSAQLQDLLNLMKLEAPLAVQVRTRSGLFPINKFSTVPLLVKASRSAENECAADDVKKRLMVVDNCHVVGLRFDGARVTAVDTNFGTVPVPTGGVVVLAMATIESTRLALNAFRGTPNYIVMGKNLIAHLRSNLNIRIPIQNIAGLTGNLEQAALFVKGRHQFADGSLGHYHLQITAAGGAKTATDAEAELFKKIPDIDQFNVLRLASSQDVVIVIRGIGEMETENPASSVRLDPEPDEFGVQRAFVSIAPNQRDLELWGAMDQAAEDVALLFAGGKPYEVLTGGGSLQVAAGQPASTVQSPQNRRDGLGTTHHEAGTLRMGDDPTVSVTDPDCKFHEVANAYAIGPAILPRTGSPNPMLSGIALARRLAEHLGNPSPFVTETGFTALFDGIHLANWRMAGPGRFIVVDGSLEAVPDPSGELGMLWCTDTTPPDFVLKMEWLRWQQNDNSGVFVRFPDPTSKGYKNQAWVAINFGFEIQIDEFGWPDQAGIHKTGAIYAQGNQNLSLQPARAPGQWNEFEIRVQGQAYAVALNGLQVTSFQNQDPSRGLASTPLSPAYVGIQIHPPSPGETANAGRVAFRRIRIAKL